VLRTSGLIWVLLLLCIVAALISPAFLNPFNLINVVRQVALFGIVSVAMTYVILTAGIGKTLSAARRGPYAAELLARPAGFGGAVVARSISSAGKLNS
jgi:ABC-type glucose/galactose transport system permease subunit